MEVLLLAFGISLVSFSGVIFFGKQGSLLGTHRYIVPFAIGAFLAVLFFDLIPETLVGSAEYGAVAIVSGFLLFYLLSNILQTYHHHHDEYGHDDNCSATKVSALMLLWGDAVHNVTDGIVIASAFVVNPAVGVVTAFGIALHEIPQEIAEFGVLRQAGYSVKKAMTLNFLSSLGVVLGAGLSLLFINLFSEYIWILTGLAAGNLLYIATSDLLPGVHKESNRNGSFIFSFLVTVAGVVIVGTLISL